MRIPVAVLVVLLGLPAAADQIPQAVTKAAEPATDSAKTLPDLGDASEVVVTPADERRIGRGFMRQARAHLDLLDDPELNAYLRTLAGKLTHAAGIEDDTYHFFIVNNAAVNAFAVPGGYIGVHTGLLLVSRSEGELASVLAHEIAHVTQRHIPRMLADQQRTTVPAIAALIAGILLAGSGSDAGSAAVAVTTAAVAQRQINFTRSFEEEADRLGMQTLVAADYDPRDMSAMFEVLLQSGRLYETALPEYLRSHPVTTRRIAEARDRATHYPAHTDPDSGAFAHMQARLRALSARDAKEAVRYFRAEHDSKRDTDANRYGLALALTRARDYGGAAKILDALVVKRPDFPAYLTAAAENSIAAGRLDEGLARYRRAAALLPDNAVVARYYAEALLKAKRADAARDWVRTALRSDARDPDLYRLLSRAAGEAGHLAEAHQAYAEYYYLNDEPKRALQQLKLAKQQPDANSYYQQSIAARALAIEAELKSDPSAADPVGDER